MASPPAEPTGSTTTVPVGSPPAEPTGFPSTVLVGGDLSNVCQPTVSNLVRQVSSAIAKLRPKYIQFPNHTDSVGARRKFYNIAKFPGF